MGNFIPFVKDKLQEFFRNGPRIMRHSVTKSIALLVIGAILIVFFEVPFRAQSMSFTFSQNSWTGGLDGGSTASHLSNQSGWNQYSSATNLTPAATVSMSTTSSATTQTTDTDFGGGTLSQTAVAGSGTNAGITLGTASTGYAWTTINYTGSTVAECCGAAVWDSAGNKMYTTDGYDQQNSIPRRDFHKFDASTNAWTAATYNDSSTYIQGVWDPTAQRVYVFGGYYDDYGPVVNNTLRSYNMSAMTVSNITNAAGTIPSARGKSVVWWDAPARKMYVYGGYTGIWKTDMYVYDAAANTWSTLTPSGGLPTNYERLGAWDQSTGKIYITSSNGSTLKQELFVYSTSTNTMSTLTPTGTKPPNRNEPLTVWDPSTNRLLMFGGYFGGSNFYNDVWAYSPSTNQWTQITPSGTPPSQRGGSMGVWDPGTNRLYVYGGMNLATSLSDMFYLSNANTYYASGNFTSSAIDSGQANTKLKTISWNATIPSGTVQFQIRSAATQAGLSSATWYGPTSSSDYYTSSGQAINAVHNGDRWFQYKAFLTTSDTTQTPNVSDVTIGYEYYNASGTLVSSAYNTTDSLNVIGTLSWTEDVSLPSNAGVTVSLRTAATSQDLSGASWSDFTNATANCTKSNGVVTCPAAAIPAALKDHTNDQWFQYKIGLSSAGSTTPQVSNVSVQYVVNNPPSFDATYGTNGITVSQVSDSNSADFGKVSISYKIKDSDASSDTTINPNSTVIPSFEYSTNGGSTWTSIASQYLAAADTQNKSTLPQDSFNTYTATWNAKSQIPNTYNTIMKVRVTVNDGELANNTASSTSALFTVDVKSPVVANAVIDGPTKTVNIKASDDSTLQYKLSNNSNLTADGSNATSGQWQTIADQAATTSVSWNFSSTSTPTVYLLLQDAYGNAIATTTIVAPSAPSQINIKDTSNVGAGDYREFISWSAYTPATGATFSKYEVYRSTNGGSTYSLLTSISNSATNYYTDLGLTGSQTYYYRVRVVDTDGDSSDYTSAVSDTADGTGGTDTVPPSISAVTAATIQPTWATITWTTNKLANSVVNYGTTTSYGSIATSTSYVTSHSVSLSNLTPNTTYYYKVTSTDSSLNTASLDNNGNSYTFTTSNGTVITDVALESASDQTATVVWYTSTNSNSFVEYATDTASLASNTNVSEAGSSALVGSSVQSKYQHRVVLTGLQSHTTYYYYVKSTDGSNQTATDANNGAYYTFITTRDITPPVISNIITPAISSNSIVVMWSTDKLSDSQVQYGTTTGAYTYTTTLSPTLTINHTQTLTDLLSESIYYFVVRSSDAQNNLAISDEQVASTTKINQVIIRVGGGGGSSAQPDTTVPHITGVSATSTGPFSARITFVTDKLTTSFIPYGRSTYQSTIGDPTFTTNHSVDITGLQMGATYHYMVKAVDKNGNVAESLDYTFATPFATEPLQDLVTLKNASQFEDQLNNLIQSMLPSLAPPYISEIAVSSTTENSAVISWTTNVPTYGSAMYVSDADVSGTSIKYTNQLSQVETKSREHTVQLTNLTPATKYHFSINAYSLPGVVRDSDDQTFATKASKIKLELSKVGNKGFEVRWYSPQQTTSVVEYTNKNTGLSQRLEDPDKVMSHSVTINDATPDTPYSIHAYGYNSRGVLVEGDTLAVKTGKDVTPPSISMVKIDNALIPGRNDRLQTVVSWLTDEAANSRVYYEEGVGSTTLTTNVNMAAYTDEHIVIIPSLKPSTVYRIQVVSTDEAGNVASSSVKTILTPHSSEDVIDVIIKNLQDSFGFLKKMQ